MKMMMTMVMELVKIYFIQTYGIKYFFFFKYMIIHIFSFI
jgi:hypothetical protein